MPTLPRPVLSYGFHRQSVGIIPMQPSAAPSLKPISEWILETVTLPGEAFVLNVEFPNTWARRMLKRVPDARIL